MHVATAVFWSTMPHGDTLAALPAPSNFSGAQHPLAPNAHERALGFDVLAFAAT